MAQYKVEIAINVREEYGNHQNMINKTVTLERYEEVMRLVGKLLQHLPKEGK